MGEQDNNSRRQFIQGMSALFGLVACGCSTELRRVLRTHFKKLKPEQIAELLKAYERDATKLAGGRQATVKATAAVPGVSYAYGLDLSHCIGCRKCVYACQEENNLSRDPQIHWIRVLEMNKSDGVNLEKSNEFYDHETVPQEDKFYMPVACQHCAEAPCVQVCPTEATWQEPDGIVVVDYDWCIGCRYCQAACPYGARHFNWGKPSVPPEEINTDMHLLGNVPREKGVVEKCTFCIQRVREGRYPACLEVCPVGARKFGNVLDPSSEIRYLLHHKNVFVLKAELDTKPRFFYFWG